MLDIICFKLKLFLYVSKTDDEAPHMLRTSTDCMDLKFSSTSIILVSCCYINLVMGSAIRLNVSFGDISIGIFDTKTWGFTECSQSCVKYCLHVVVHEILTIGEK